MIITIDGPIATGKSSIAKKLAETLGYIYFDTGAMYRSLTYGIQKHQIDIHNESALKSFLDAFDFDIKIYKGEKRYIVEGEDVTLAIRRQEVTAFVSEVSALQLVRDKLVSMQRELAKGVNAIFEGRDMGSVVFPHAELKIFLTGRAEVRAKRRYQELLAKFPEESKNLTMETLMEEINKRDHYDSTRKIAPLIKPQDAFIVDTSDLSVEEIVFKILEHKDSLPG